MTHHTEGHPIMTCLVDDCDRDIAAKGMCSSHHKRWRKHGDPGPAFVTPLTTAEMADELIWQLDAGESAWQAARAVGFRPASILQRLYRCNTIDEDTRQRLCDTYNPLAREVAA